LPVVTEGHGLASALEHYAGEVSELFHVECRFEGNGPAVPAGALADHLHRLAQEAVTNAIKHGRAKNITIGLGGGVLTIRDDGCGFDVGGAGKSGLGLRIMSYRAKMIGGSLTIHSAVNEGTMVKCSFPIEAQNGA
jgi:two-component system, LuxR family, sensor kinase FixL